MKLIAHRGASLERPENSLESLEYGSELGAFAVECDVRMTADGVYIIFHDDRLERLGGDPRAVDRVTFDELRAILSARGKRVLTLDELFAYRGRAAVLLHIKLPHPDAAFFERLTGSGIDFICGMTSVEMTGIGHSFFPPNRILAFMETIHARESCQRLARQYHTAGAGIIRLWEQWLDFVTPDDIRKVCPYGEVYIMANSPRGGMNGNLESLIHMKSLHADGVLLNDIRLGIESIGRL